MRINKTFYIYEKRADNTIITNIFDDFGRTEYNLQSGERNYSVAKNILKICRTRKSDIDKNVALRRAYGIMGLNEDQIASRLFDESVFTDAIDEETGKMKKVVDKRVVTDAINNLIKFFTEFNFSPSFRFINCLAIAPNKANYVRNYFLVQDHPYAAEISEKIKSAEFTNIINVFKSLEPTPINTRFELYFGEPGTGKTTKAMKMADKCIVCSSDMLPTDLMQNFTFKNGKADFDPSDLWIAMEKGKTIVLDEVNMLPFESLRFLQGITDSKDTFDFKGHCIKIHPDFKIYATMNLNVNGQCIPLPAPLVDRSYDIVEFKLTAKDLLSAVI